MAVAGSFKEEIEDFSVTPDDDDGLSMATVESIVREVCREDRSDGIWLLLSVPGSSREPSIPRAGGVEAKSVVAVA